MGGNIQKLVMNFAPFLIMTPRLHRSVVSTILAKILYCIKHMYKT